MSYQERRKHCTNSDEVHVAGMLPTDEWHEAGSLRVAEERADDGQSVHLEQAVAAHKHANSSAGLERGRREEPLRHDLAWIWGQGAKVVTDF